jgi:hypothetical protein
VRDISRFTPDLNIVLLRIVDIEVGGACKREAAENSTASRLNLKSVETALKLDLHIA